jgi:hypothetical protein
MSRSQVQNRISVRRWLFLILISLSLAALVGLMSNQIFTRPATSNTVWNECGGTPDEAHRRGCRFDILSFAWQTPECYDHENTEAFRKHNGTWSYFADPEGTELRSEEVAMTGEYMTFVTAGYHFYALYVYVEAATSRVRNIGLYR